MDWIKKFENEFGLNSKSKKKDEILKIIIGESSYKQELNGTEFKAISKKPPFKDFECISFLVNDWIKVQDSLEMMFNLLFKSSDISLKAISYLRSNKIPAEEFGIYLFNTYDILLINRYLNSEIVNKSFVGIDDRKSYVQKFINECEYNSTHILFVGENSFKNFYTKGLLINEEYCVVIHPSGNNLNNPKTRNKYYDIWYKFDCSKVKSKTSKFDLNNFHIV